MSAESSIEWTDATWNPVRGCTKVSPGCKHCYAETFAERFRGVPGHPYEQGFDLHMVADKLTDPLGWTKPKTIFVNSMSDMFHERVGLDFIGLAAKVMREADWHVFQLLTKRSARLASLPGDVGLMAPNLIVGVSVEDRKYGLPRIDDLRRAKVSRRFLSIEPLLEDLGEIDLDGIDWVIVGGESGPGARPMESRWARSIRDQCAAAGVPFFFKQWGGVRKKEHGRELDGQIHDETPDFEKMTATVPGARERKRRRVEVEGLIAEVRPRLAAIRPRGFASLELIR